MTPLLLIVCVIPTYFDDGLAIYDTVQLHESMIRACYHDFFGFDISCKAFNTGADVSPVWAMALASEGASPNLFNNTFIHHQMILVPLYINCRLSTAECFAIASPHMRKDPVSALPSANQRQRK